MDAVVDGEASIEKVADHGFLIRGAAEKIRFAANPCLKEILPGDQRTPNNIPLPQLANGESRSALRDEIISSESGRKVAKDGVESGVVESVNAGVSCVLVIACSGVVAVESGTGVGGNTGADCLLVIIGSGAAAMEQEVRKKKAAERTNGWWWMINIESPPCTGRFHSIEILRCLSEGEKAVYPDRS
jgi:hypothetical protein